MGPSGKHVVFLVDCTGSSGQLRHTRLLNTKLLAAPQLVPSARQLGWVNGLFSGLVS